jgi:predicted membrane channel-forming protein YqfA (hemolysin III family)
MKIINYKLMTIMFLSFSIIYSFLTTFPDADKKIIIAVSILCSIFGIISYLLMREEQDKQSKKLEKDLITINTFHNPAN